MSDIAIRVKNLSKQYRIGQHRHNKTLRDNLADAIYTPLRRLSQLLNGKSETVNQDSNNTIWALRNVSFEVKHGEIVGIIGHNGAGKSTLLKILTRITEPTEGYADIYGRVGSLLEVGTGFHSELTGRENIYLNGAILGMKKAEIDRKFDVIVAFSEVEKFLDTPVKHYSSGMYVRLAFAVAAHLEPEILIVDEVLAVGDAAFQKKCIGKMGDVARDGRTVLFVSHNMTAVQGLCDRVIWVENGRLKEEGEPSRVVSSYLQTSYSTLTEQVWFDKATAPGNDKVRLRRVCVRPEDGLPSDPITMRTPIIMEFEFWNLVQDAHLNLNFQLITEQGIVAFASDPVDESVWHVSALPIGLFRSRCYIPGDLLNAGQHNVILKVIKDGYYIIYQYDEALVFRVQDSVELRAGWYGKMVGTVRPLLKWTTELLMGESETTIDTRQ